ncbi:MAG: preprotein translocase subunit SecY [Dehalococcoidia bacterium]|nr:preprotein translocase subunit SecY [Dehalococcoidia bacterium]
MLQAVIDSFRQPDLRRKLLFTFGLLVVFRFVAHVPVPGVDFDQLDRIFQNNVLLGTLSLFSGGALQNLSIASLGVYPYITASIVLQLLVPVIPKLQEISKEGEQGRLRLNRYTHWLTVPLAFGQGYGQLVLLQNQGAISNFGFSGPNLLPTLAMLVAMTAGTLFLVWLGELITENGIGNGVSIIIFGGIVASIPTVVGGSFLSGNPVFRILTVGGVAVLLVFAIVFFQEAVRRVPVQYSRSLFRGGRMYRQAGSSFIPLRVNSAGMIPLIFAISILILPFTVASYFPGSSLANTIRDLFSVTNWLYWALYFFMVVAFTFFYTMVIFQQQNLADTLQKQGGFVPGIRPGKPTQDYLLRVITRITWAGAVFLGLVAVAPYLIGLLLPGAGLSAGAQAISSTALLIVVGVVLDSMRQLEAQLLMRNYEGFLK